MNRKKIVSFVKVRFTSKEHGSTSGLVLDEDKAKKMSIADISRLFPYSEAPKMHKLEISPSYSHYSRCFEHDFNAN